MSTPKRAALLGPLVLLAAVSAFATASDAPARSEACAGGYTYAGRLNASRAHGIRATLTALARPTVAAGHVAAWIGVGGVGQGPKGTDAWIQVGLSAFPGSESRLYYEVARPGVPPTYTEIASGADTGERFRVAVLEVASRPGFWRVWLNGRAVSAPIEITGSSGRWRPIATAESWGAGGNACNRFTYRFEDLRVASARGGSWRSFVGGHTFLDAGYRLVDRGRTTFVATTG